MTATGSSADGRPSRLVAVDPVGGAVRPVSVIPRPYHRLRGGPTGQAAVCTSGPGDRGALVAVGGPDAGVEHLIQVGEDPLRAFDWLTTVFPPTGAPSPE